MAANRDNPKYSIEAESIGSIGNEGSITHSAGKVEGDQIGTQNNISGEAEAAAIQELIDRLSQSYSTQTTAGQMQVATEAIATIENTPGWKQRAVRALVQGSLKVLESNPVGAFVVGAIAGWKEQ